MVKCKIVKEEINLRGSYTSVRCAQIVLRLADLGASGGFIKRILGINCAERKVRSLISEMKIQAHNGENTYSGKKGRHTSSTGWYVHEPDRLIHCTYLMNFLRVVSQEKGEPRDTLDHAELLIETYLAYLKWEGVNAMTARIPFTRFFGATRLVATGQLVMRHCRGCHSEYLDRAVTSRDKCPLCLQVNEYNTQLASSLTESPNTGLSDTYAHGITMPAEPEST